MLLLLSSLLSWLLLLLPLNVQANRRGNNGCGVIAIIVVIFSFALSRAIHGRKFKAVAQQNSRETPGYLESNHFQAQDLTNNADNDASQTPH